MSAKNFEGRKFRQVRFGKGVTIKGKSPDANEVVTFMGVEMKQKAKVAITNLAGRLLKEYKEVGFVDFSKQEPEHEEILKKLMGIDTSPVKLEEIK